MFYLILFSHIKKFLICRNSGTGFLKTVGAEIEPEAVLITDTLHAISGNTPGNGRGMGGRVGVGYSVFCCSQILCIMLFSCSMYGCLL